MYSKIVVLNYCTRYFLSTMAKSNMEADKENVYRTRIPLPKEPLPALPRHLLTENKKHQENLHQRCPLKPLNSQFVPRAGPSKAILQKPKKPLKIDARFVTLRQKSENLDWNYKVFRDEHVKNDTSVISISDDEKYLDERQNERYFVEHRKKNNLGEALSAVTPQVKACLEPNPIRNIKRSLKRPHSRELQGLSPNVAAKHEKLDDRVKRRLQFNERIQDRLASPDVWKRSYMRCLNRDYTTDVFDYLLAVERKPLGELRTSRITRACVVNWLMKVNGADGNPAIIQAACWYLDSILGTGHVQLDKLQLVAAACFWIAQKLNGPVIPAIRLVRYSNGAFTTEKLLAAEKAVLLRLSFPQQPVVAQDYITYLSWWCDNRGGEVEVAATFLCMCGLMVDPKLCEDFPSVIAAAAVRNAVLLLRKSDLLARLHMSHVYKAAEKKATSFSITCSILRRAVRTVAAPIYEYKAPFEHYGSPPCFIAQKIINVVNELSAMDTRNIDRK
ncbi:uncharacterized protein LOC113499189 [Trichoplusia ni]|uniref:Uncharacterized protein LOC113499189 n=1 Tax=Trichoplusia ni TaxID=7111 RepID=A0A7E5W3Y9_TRINI|nr:uncharacterized protein LOC113499189 [Trichoplusia ni]